MFTTPCKVTTNNSKLVMKLKHFVDRSCRKSLTSNKCESHKRHVNEDKGNISIVFKARISEKGIFAVESKQPIPCGFKKFLKHSKNPKETLIKK